MPNLMIPGLRPGTSWQLAVETVEIKKTTNLILSADYLALNLIQRPRNLTILATLPVGNMASYIISILKILGQTTSINLVCLDLVDLLLSYHMRWSHDTVKAVCNQ